MAFDRYDSNRPPSRKELLRLQSEAEENLEKLDGEWAYAKIKFARLAQTAEKDLDIKPGTLTFFTNADAMNLGRLALYHKLGYVIYQNHAPTEYEEKAGTYDPENSTMYSVFSTPDSQKLPDYDDDQLKIINLQQQYIRARLVPGYQFYDIKELEAKLGGYLPHIDEFDNAKISIPLSRDELMEFTLDEKQRRMIGLGKDNDSNERDDR